MIRLIAAGILIFCGILTWCVYMDGKCALNGGVFVRTLDGFVCLRAERIKL